MIGNHSTSQLTAYCDANWAGDKGDRKSTGGFVIFLHGSPIAWQSRKQRIVAQSSAEAEYITLSDTAREVSWFHSLLTGMRTTIPPPHIIYEDNQSTIHMAGSGNSHGRTKHIDVRYHYIREQVESGIISVQYIPTESQTADIFMKPLTHQRFELLRRQLGVIKLD